MTIDEITTKNIHLPLERKYPLKRTYRISNKTIIVIDETLVKLHSIDEDKTWFEEQATAEGILLKIHSFNVGRQNDKSSIRDLDKTGDHSLGQ